MRKRKIGLYVPLYNAEKTIENVINTISDKTLTRLNLILFIDNYSSDNSINKIFSLLEKRISLKKKVIIMKNRVNKGPGASQKIAFDYLIKNNFTHIVRLHAGGRTDSDKYLNDHFDRLELNPNISMIHASRFNKNSNIGNYNKLRVLGNKFFNRLTSILFKIKIEDAGSAEALYNSNDLSKINYKNLINDHRFNPHLNILIYKNFDKIISIPLIWKESESHLKVFKYSITLLFDLFRVYCYTEIFNRNINKLLIHSDSEYENPEVLFHCG